VASAIVGGMKVCGCVVANELNAGDGMATAGYS